MRTADKELADSQWLPIRRWSLLIAYNLPIKERPLPYTLYIELTSNLHINPLYLT